MYTKDNAQRRKNVLAAAIATTLGVAASMPGLAIADIYTWGALVGPASSTTTCANSPKAATIIFTMLDPNGAAMNNTSAAKGANGFQTPTCGTLTYNTKTKSGTVQIGAFDFFHGTAPAVATNITINKVPAGLDDGSGNLILANMLFNWSGNNGIPVSISWNAKALLNEMDGTPTTFTLKSNGSINTSSALTATGGIPGSDGTYTGPTFSYLNLGPSPLATTDFNTTNVVSCAYNACSGVNPSADIAASSAVPDTTLNPNRKDPAGYGKGTGIGGNPMQDGPFAGNNANFDFTSMTLVSFTDTTPPVITLKGTSPLSVTINSGPYTDAGATCADAAPVGGNLVVTRTGTVDTTTGGIYTIKYDCTDGSGNPAQQLTRTVIIASPGAPPLIALNGNNPVTHECATLYADKGAICADYKDGLITNSALPLPTFIPTNNIKIGTPGSYTETWSCINTSNQKTTLDRIVNVVDTTAPVIKLAGPAIVNRVSSTLQNPSHYVDKGASATDSCDATAIGVTTNNPVKDVVPDTGNATVTYTVTYDAKDLSGNKGTASRTVNVTRSQPVIKLVGGGVVLKIGKPYIEHGMDITDAQDGNLTTITASGSGNGVGAGGGLLTYTVNASNVDTSKQGNYKVYYNVTDSNGNFATQVVRAVQVGLFATGSNFTMLDAKGNVFGGTNDVTFDWDQTTNNDQTNYKNDLNFNMVIASQKPQRFFGFTWVAHDTRVFGPGTYSFDTGCTVAEIHATGCPAGSAAKSGPTITMTVKPGQVGAHILFDWNTSKNIDVVNVWDKGGVWNRHGLTGAQNKLWDGQAGKNPDPTTTWKLVSTDINGDGFNGSPMVDGPFQKFYANFNAGPGGTVAAPPPYVGTAPDTKVGSGLASLSILSLFAALATLLGLRRFGKKNNN